MTIVRRNEQGFTLIELLVVVSIVGILSAIGIASFTEYRKRAFLAANETLLHNVTTDAQNYTMTENYNRNATAWIRWDVGASAPTTSGAIVAEVLPSVRVNEGYQVWASIRSSSCGSESQDQIFTYATAIKAAKYVQRLDLCSGAVTKSEVSKNVGDWW